MECSGARASAMSGIRRAHFDVDVEGAGHGGSVRADRRRIQRYNGAIMRVAIVCHGDVTTTRGKVFAVSADMHDGGRKIALFGDQASCGNCPGLWNIHGTGEGVGEGTRAAVVNGDYVLCPCKRNRVLASADAGLFMFVERERARVTDAFTAASDRGVSAGYDECVVLYSTHTGTLLRDVRYRFMRGTSVVAEGVTDAKGRTERVCRYSEETLELQVKGL
jgi:uncharacterized Zn-binding protein involved in type VI secretion